MSKKTHTNPLSKREVEILRASPYVQAVTATTVRFTEEFKQKVYREKCEGTPVRDILRRHGIDPEMLGESRVHGFAYLLNKKARSEAGFADRRKTNYRRPPQAEAGTVEQRIKSLENELAYTRQEVEFLKKLQAANMEAQKQWESKHRQK